MNPPDQREWHRLFNAALNDELSDADKLELASVLKSTAEARQLWFLYHDNECSMAEMKRPVERKTRKAGLSWLAWRPLTAAAAGIVFGMFCTSVAFGYLMPRAVVTASRLIALVDGSFETLSGRLASGFPREFGKWSGNVAEIVGGNAKDGQQVLRFVKAEPSAAVANSPAQSCDVFQLVDLRSLKADAPGSETTLELSAQVLDARSEPDEEISFVCWITVFSGSPRSMRHEEALAKGSGIIHSTGGEPQKWRSVKAKVLLPPQADFAVMQIMARKESTRHNMAAEFGEQFADDVLLTLKTQPTLPVRVSNL